MATRDVNGGYPVGSWSQRPRFADVGQQPVLERGPCRYLPTWLLSRGGGRAAEFPLPGRDQGLWLAPRGDVSTPVELGVVHALSRRRW